jgi:hypothetical protein
VVCSASHSNHHRTPACKRRLVLNGSAEKSRQPIRSHGWPSSPNFSFFLNSYTLTHSHDSEVAAGLSSIGSAASQPTHLVDGVGSGHQVVVSFPPARSEWNKMHEYSTAFFLSGLVLSSGLLPVMSFFLLLSSLF